MMAIYELSPQNLYIVLKIFLSQNSQIAIKQTSD